MRRDDNQSRFIGSMIVKQKNLLDQMSHILDSYDSMQSDEEVFEPKLIILNAIEVVSMLKLSKKTSIKLRTDPCLPQEVRGDMHKL